MSGNYRKINLPEYCKYLAENPISIMDQRKFRTIIKNKIEKRVVRPLTPENFDKIITSEIFTYMLKLYDSYFFNHSLLKFFKENKCALTICYGHKCASVAGLCRLNLKNRCYTIELSPKTFKKAFSKNRIFDIGNINCKNILECILLTFEHELIHALGGCFCYMEHHTNKGPGNWSGKTSPKTGHSKTFMSILYNTFGHKKYTHGLFGRTELSQFNNPEGIKRLKLQLRVGYTISYQVKISGKIMLVYGTITKINRTRIRVKSHSDSKIWNVSILSLKSINGNKLNELLDISNNRYNATINNTPFISENPIKIKHNKKSITPTIVPKKTKLPTKLVIKKSPKKTITPTSPPIKSILPTKLVIRPKRIKYAYNIDKFKKIHRGKGVVKELSPCSFPFKYKGELYNDCLDTGKGAWCATKTKKNKTIDVWGYCT